MKKQLKGFVVGVILTTILMSTVSFAGSLKKKISDVFFMPK